MASSADFRDFVLDLLAPLGGVSARPMFGGFGVYRDSVIFALISDDTLYLKADAGLRAEFEAAGMAQFRPLSKGKPFPMPYYETPAELLEDADALIAHARKASAAAGTKSAATGGAKGRSRATARSRSKAR